MTRTKNRRRCWSRRSSSKNTVLVLVRVVGSHFLWRMVRRIVGVLVEAGRGV
jgi:tRNA U38,U39,U40 pseudouridine synthase TruA